MWTLQLSAENNSLVIRDWNWDRRFAVQLRSESELQISTSPWKLHLWVVLFGFWAGTELDNIPWLLFTVLSPFNKQLTGLCSSPALLRIPRESSSRVIVKLDKQSACLWHGGFWTRALTSWYFLLWNREIFWVNSEAKDSFSALDHSLLSSY